MGILAGQYHSLTCLPTLEAGLGAPSPAAATPTRPPTSAAPCPRLLVTVLCPVSCKVHSSDQSVQRATQVIGTLGSDQTTASHNRTSEPCKTRHCAVQGERQHSALQRGTGFQL